ncbi:TPA: hypothetical protein ACHJSU_002578, partial [Escherichia coli]
ISSKMKAVTFYLIMVCDFKFILWINCEAELIREEKQKKRRRVRRLGLFAISCRMRRKCLTRPGRT